MRRRFVAPMEYAPSFIFKTKNNGTVSFEITKTGIPATWDMGDGTVYTEVNSVTHTYADSTEKTVSVSVGDIFDNVTGIGDFSNKAITWFDASNLNNVSGVILFKSNADLSEWLPPTNHVGLITALYFEDSDSLTSFDASGLVFGQQAGFNLGSRIYFRRSGNLTSFSFPSNLTEKVDILFDNTALSNPETFMGLEDIGRLYIDNSPFTGALNLQSCTSLGDLIAKNTLLTTIDFHPVSVQRSELWGLWAHGSSNILVSLDFSKNTVNSNARFWIASSNLTEYIEPIATNKNIDFKLDAPLLSGVFSPVSVNRFSSIIMISIQTEINFLPLDQMRGNITFSSSSLAIITNLEHQSTLLNKASGLRFTIPNGVMDSSMVNYILETFDSYSPVSVSDCGISIIGGNAAPDSTSGGYNGTAAKASLIAKGYTVQTN